MVMARHCRRLLVFVWLVVGGVAWAQSAGSIRGVVQDDDFDVPLAAARVTLAETNEQVQTSEEGNYVFPALAPGSYTLVFTKDDYKRQVRSGVVVAGGRLTELNVSLAGEFTELEEFVVQEIQFETGGETALLELRMETPALIDSISADLISQAGAGDAASALNLVAGASVQDGKYAVVRGLPDRYVNSQINGVRLPTADADKRAVELDQFPSSAIQNIQVSKTFTPDQQGDASGGAVNLILKGIPEEAIFNLNASASYNDQVAGSDSFLSYDGGGAEHWARIKGRDAQVDKLGQNWSGAVGAKRADAPLKHKWGLQSGGKYEFDNSLKIGAMGSLFYERDVSHYDKGKNDSLWVTTPGGPMTPQTGQGSPEQGDFKTSLWDVTRSSDEVKWGGLGVLGLESENHRITYAQLYTRAAEDTVTLAEDKRGKAYYFPGYDAKNPNDPGNQQPQAAPWLRTETLDYSQRVTQTSQLSGHHKLFDPDIVLGHALRMLRPEVDWTVAYSVAESTQPDKRQFGSMYYGPSYNPGFPPYLPPFTTPEQQLPYKPAANFTLGNLQRIWKEIREESQQWQGNIKFPYENWTGKEGFLKFGLFRDEVHRTYNQDSYSNFNDNEARYLGPWDDHWSSHFPQEDHPVTAADIDVDYRGDQLITANYYMFDVPILPFFKITGGVRNENTELSIINYPEKDVTWLPPGATAPYKLNPGDADVKFQQNDALPQLGFEYTPFESVTMRVNYAETVARQTFKELTPIQQQEYLGSDIFIGNPFLQMSALKNYDFRLDYAPYNGGLLSTSLFYKDITDPIEYVQKYSGSFEYTAPVNYPSGKLSGYELEMRQSLGHFARGLEGLDVGANATFIQSEVTLPAEEARQFDEANIAAPMKTRDMTNAPNHLYNLYLTYELDKLGLKGMQYGVFYTVRGDALIAGAGTLAGNFVPSIYEKEYGTLNMSLSQKLGKHLDFKLQAKNLLDPSVDTVYRSEYIGKDVTKTSYKKGREYSFSLSTRF